MSLESSNKNNIESNEVQNISQETIEQKEISQEELVNWLDQEEDSFKRETQNELSKSNSIGLDEQTFEQVKMETNIDGDLNNIDFQMDEIILQAKEQSNDKIESPTETKKELIDETYAQYYINNFIDSSKENENVLEVNFLKNYQTMVKKDEFEKITPYLRSGHQSINGLLREDKEVNIENVLQYKGKEISDFNKEWDSDIVESFIALEDSIEKSQFTVPKEGVGREVYRHTKADYLQNLNSGDTITEKSFLSTSIDKSYNDYYLNYPEEETLLTIKFPENSIVNGIYIDNIEKEFLLPRNMSYKIIDKKISIINGFKKIEIEAEFLPNKYIHILE